MNLCEGILTVYRLQYLTDPATGAYRALGQRRLNDIRKIGKLLRLQKEQRALDKQERRCLEEKLRVMRGQALPQPAAAEFAAAIHAGYKKAASEGRQLVLSQLSLDVTAADIERFFGDLGVETICIEYDSITGIPTGVAHVNMETSRGAHEAVQSLAEKKLLGKEVHLKLNIDRNASGITRLVRELSILPDRVGHDFGTSPKPVINGEPAGGSTTYLHDKSKRPLSVLRKASLTPSIITNPIEVCDEGKEQVKQARHAARLRENGEAKSNAEERSASSTADDSRAALSRQPLARLVRLDSYLEMANQERATFGLVPLTRTPGDSVHAKE
jgi:RNA recognition motif. (a.k.a. RRM, RBD, or RNP domain)